jgi:copper resistance protein B
VELDELEWLASSDTFAWQADAWYGSDRSKLRLETEGERVGTGRSTTRMQTHLLWDSILSRWWDLRVGVRHDSASHQGDRSSLAAGVRGLAPYGIEIEVLAYVGEGGRTAARFKAEYPLLMTQRWILLPELEANVFGKDDRERRLGAGVADVELGMRLRYEIRRELAPYIGVRWKSRFGETADLWRAAGQDVSDIEALAGIRLWF